LKEKRGKREIEKEYIKRRREMQRKKREIGRKCYALICS
jgi:hypothetical protein